MSLENKISKWIRDYLDESGNDCLVVGVSGGIDSALTSTLCARTDRKTILVTMPIHQNVDETNRGIKHINWLKTKYDNISHLHINLSSVYDKLKDAVPKNCKTDLALANTRARIRMTNLYLISGSNNGIVVGTGNKVEDFGVGFYTKYGDGGVDISPIADLMKSEVYDISKKLNIIDEIIDASPTDGLWSDGRTDEDQLGVNYDELEWAMKYCKKNNINSIVADSEINSLSDDKLKILRVYLKYRNANLHKMLEIPVFKK